MWYDGQSWLWLSWDKTDLPPQHHRGCSQQTHVRRREQQVVRVPALRPRAAMVKYCLVLRLLEPRRSAHFLCRSQEGSRVKYFLSARVGFVHPQASASRLYQQAIGQQRTPLPFPFYIPGFVMLPLQLSAQHLRDRMGWLGPGWHSQDQDNSSRGFCFCAASSCGLCSNIHEAERHRLSASPQRRLPRA